MMDEAAIDFWITVYWVVLLRLGRLLLAVAVAFIVLGVAGVVALVLGEGNKENDATSGRPRRTPATQEERPGLVATLLHR
jgi:hypothetical protein